MAEMKAVKFSEGPVSGITQEIKGWWLITYFNGEVWKKENLAVGNRLTKAQKNYFATREELIAQTDENTGEEIEASKEDVEKMVQTYITVKHKYTNQYSTYKPTGRFWIHFEKAARISRKYGLDAYAYITIIRNHYTSRVKENRVVFPWPSQIGGENAEEIISNHIANQSGNIPEEVQALRMAQAKRNVPLEEDEQFITSKRKFKTGKFTRKDLEYVKIRYNQVGKSPDWLDKYEKMLKDREAKT